jgi:hypothetical protein
VKKISSRNNFPIPAVTTFGAAPVINDIESRKAYQSWLVARVIYECFRWVCWTLMATGIAAKIVTAIGIVV